MMWEVIKAIIKSERFRSEWEQWPNLNHMAQREAAQHKVDLSKKPKRYAPSEAASGTGDLAY